MFILTVKELFSNIKINLESSFAFVMVRGTVIKVRWYNNKNLYFTLSDNGQKEYTISCVCWHSQLHKYSINPSKEDILNQDITIKGYIQVYKSATQVTLVVIDLLRVNESQATLLHKEKENRLKQLGYFDSKYKKAIPPCCNVVGLITSSDSDALHDICHSIKERFPATILLYSSSIQGALAVSNIIKAINYFNNMPEESKPKALLITRGGGSKEDLEIFNEESLVTAIFNSCIPVITAIGHSTDISLADYAADHYAITPTAAAEILFSTSISTYQAYLSQYQNILKKLLLDKINILKIKQQAVENQVLRIRWSLAHQTEVIAELQRISLHALKSKYADHQATITMINTELYHGVWWLMNRHTASLIHLKEKFFKSTDATRNLHLKLAFITKNLNTVTYDYIQQKYHRSMQLNYQLWSLKPNVNNQILELEYLNQLLKKQVSNFIKITDDQFNYTLNLLISNSYPQILKRGYTIIKDKRTGNIITKSNQIAPNNSFEIMFHDASVTITPK